MSQPTAQLYEFGEFHLDPMRRVLFRRDGSTVPLTPRVFNTLLELVRHSGTVLDKERLMEAIWPDSIVEENNLTQNISTLRRVFGEQPGAHRYIMTVPGRGYRFLAEVTVRNAEEIAPAIAVTPEAMIDPPPTKPAAVPRKSRSALIIGAVAALVVALVLAWWVNNRDLPVGSIAVLPFKPLVGDKGDQVLEIGMADTLIAKLSNSQEIVVRPLSSVRKFGRLEQDPLAAGRELGVSSVLDGSIQRAGDRIHVSARLLKVRDGKALWTDTFDEKFTDVFSVQDAISDRVTHALALRLSPKEKACLTKRDTENAEAYQLYLTGRYHFSRLTPPEVTTSIGFFKQAVALDPGYALAYFGLAEAHRALAITSDVAPKETMPQARAAALKALEIDEALAEAHASLVFTRTWFDWDWAGAERDAKRALELNPNLGLAHVAYANLLSDEGRHPEAIAQAARARELDPVSLITNLIEGSVLYHARRNDEAKAQLEKTLALDPNFWVAHLFLGKVLLMQQGHYPEAIAEFGQAREISRGNSETIAMTGYVWGLAGETEKARAALEELKSAANQHYVPPHNIAVVYLGLGERDETFAWLEKAYEDRDVRLSFLKVDPKWDPLRADARFVALLQRLGL